MRGERGLNEREVSFLFLLDCACSEKKNRTVLVWGEKQDRTGASASQPCMFHLEEQRGALGVAAKSIYLKVRGWVVALRIRLVRSKLNVRLTPPTVYLLRLRERGVRRGGVKANACLRSGGQSCFLGTQRGR